METDLPDDVLEAIHANRKVEAIKRLREQHNIDLTEAKAMVDAYISGNPQLNSRTGSRTETRMGRVMMVLVVIAVVYAAYRLMS